MFFRGASDVLYFDTQQFSIPVIHNTSIHDVFDRSVCAFFLSRLSFGYLSQSLHQKKFSTRVFFYGCVLCSVIFFMFRFSIRSFWSFFLFVFSILRCIFVIYRGDLREKKYFRNQDMFTLQ